MEATRQALLNFAKKATEEHPELEATIAENLAKALDAHDRLAADSANAVEFPDDVPVPAGSANQPVRRVGGGW